jgi:hypothetical protein
VRVDDPSLALVRDDTIDSDDVRQTLDASITAFNDNSYVVSYTLDNGSGNTDVLARIVSSTGTVGGPITVADNGTAAAGHSQLATLSNNSFVVLYQKFVDTDNDIYFQIYTASGAAVKTDAGVTGGFSTVEETDPDVAALTGAGGGFVVGWTDAAGDAAGQGVRLSIYDNSGNLLHGDIQVNTTTAGNQNEVSLLALHDGGFIATWEDDGVSAVRGQRFDAMGNKIGTEFLVKDNSATGNPTDSHDSAVLSDGRFAYAISDVNSGGADIDVQTSIWSANRTPVVANAIADQTSPANAYWTFQVPANTYSDADGDSLS